MFVRAQATHTVLESLKVLEWVFFFQLTAAKNQMESKAKKEQHKSEADVV